MPNLLESLDKTHWQTFRFDEIARNISERVEPGATDLAVYVGLEHIDSGSLHIKRTGVPSDVDGTKLRVYAGDVIFGRRRAYQRKAAVATFDGICSAHALVLRAKSEVIDPRLFPFFLHSDAFMHRAVDISVGGLSPTINWGNLKLEKFMLPPLDQQARLAELLWAADEVGGKYLFQLEQIYKVKAALLEQIYESPGKESIPLLNVGRWLSGGTPNRANASFWNGDIPWASPKDMKVDWLGTTQETVTAAGAKAGSALLPVDTILMVVRGMILAHTFPVALTTAPMSFNQDMKALIVSENYNPRFVFYFLKHMADYVLANTAESTHGTKRVTTETITQLLLPIYDKEEEAKLLNKVTALENTVIHLKGQIAQNDKLKNYVINSIF
jgi:type I restriction enzyme S subunit